jgi:cellulose synthase/poly-beta-1,6-N-acetylglucosamine synthase-like glycosyltransferase
MESGVLASRRPDDVVVVVVDADGQLEPSALVEVAPSFRNPQMGAVQIGVRMRNADTNTLTRMQDMEFVVYTELFQRARHQIGSAGLGGNGQFVRLTALESLGDDPWSDYLTEDLDLGLRILAAGWETAFCPRTHVDQQAVTTLPKLIRQRTRWYQGHLQCWSRIPSLVRSSLRMRVVTDLMFHLLIALAVLLTGLLSITFVAALTVYTITNPSDAFDFATSGSSWRLGLWYVASFGLCWIYAYVYWLVTPKRSFLRVLATAHLFLMYTYIWVAAGVWALWRIAARKTSWAKTSRIQEHGDEDVDESDVPSNVVVPFDRSDAARS